MLRICFSKNICSFQIPELKIPHAQVIDMEGFLYSCYYKYIKSTCYFILY